MKPTNKTIIHTENAPAPVGPYSQAVRSGDLLLISGQLGLKPGSTSLPESLEDQTRQMLKNLVQILTGAGLGPEHVIKTTCFLADMGDFAVFNGVYGEIFSDAPPARSCVAVRELPLGARVEIEAIATFS